MAFFLVLTSLWLVRSQCNTHEYSRKGSRGVFDETNNVSKTSRDDDEQLPKETNALARFVKAPEAQLRW